MADRLIIQLLDDALQQRLDDAIEALSNPRELMEAIGGKLEENTQLRFVSKTDPNGAPWQELAESTLKRKKGRGSILELSGLMKGSLGSNVGADGRDVEVGFGERYAGYHETGSKDGKRPPRRGLLLGSVAFGDIEGGQLGDADRADVMAEVDRYLAELL